MRGVIALGAVGVVAVASLTASLVASATTPRRPALDATQVQDLDRIPVVTRAEPASPPRSPLDVRYCASAVRLFEDVPARAAALVAAGSAGDANQATVDAFERDAASALSNAVAAAPIGLRTSLRTYGRTTVLLSELVRSELARIRSPQARAALDAVITTAEWRAASEVVRADAQGRCGIDASITGG